MQICIYVLFKAVSKYESLGFKFYKKNKKIK